VVPFGVFSPIRLALLLCFVFLLGACATSTSPQGDEWLFERQGRFALVAEGAGQRSTSTQGGFIWRESAQAWQIDLLSPLGATLARLTVTPEGALLQEPDAPDQRAASANELLARLLREPVPADAMKDWLKGRIVQTQDVSDLRRDAQDRIVGFKQSGWTVTFDRYDEQGPRLVGASSASGGRTLLLRLVVDDPG